VFFASFASFAATKQESERLNLKWVGFYKLFVLIPETPFSMALFDRFWGKKVFTI
jgi:hypothetical protein